MDPTIYHVFNKSIQHFTIFNDYSEYERFLLSARFYQYKDHPEPLSNYVRRELDINDYLSRRTAKLVKICTYCLMPTHFHFILAPLIENGISEFIRLLCNSYTHYFNLKHHRKGPLWQSKYKSVHVTTDEQYLYLTRYVHRNPVKALLVKKAVDWPHSSIHEYINKNIATICEYSEFLLIDPLEYQSFIDEESRSEEIIDDVKIDS